MIAKEIKRIRNLYIIATILTLTFGIIYELFSHGVYSAYMICAFAIPLIPGVVVFSVLFNVKRFPRVNAIGATIYNSGVATLTIGSIFAGVLEIYGTTNKLLYVYPVVGIALVVAGIVCGFAISQPKAR